MANEFDSWSEEILAQTEPRPEAEPSPITGADMSLTFDSGLPLGRLAEQLIEADRAIRTAALDINDRTMAVPYLVGRMRLLPVDSGYEVERVEDGSLVYILHASHQIFDIVVSAPVAFPLHVFEIFGISHRGYAFVRKKKTPEEKPPTQPKEAPRVVELPEGVREDLDAASERRRRTHVEEPATVEQVIEAVARIQPPKRGFRRMDVIYRLPDGSEIEVSSTVQGRSREKPPSSPR